MSEVPAAPAPAPAAPATYPGKTLGIVGLIVAIFFNVIGVILSAVALSQSKKAGYKNTPAKAGIIVGIVLFVLTIVIWVAFGALIVGACNSGAAECTTTTY